MTQLFSGNLFKMPAQYGTPISYSIRFDEGELQMNQLLGKKISICFDGQINCVSCGKLTKKAFGQGFCYPCFATAPENAECIVRPELCEGHLGKGRNPEWEQLHHVQPHFVYLALSSGLKVGITRGTQIPTRWIDQGATAAIILAEVPFRQLSGLIEVALKPYYSDKTNWQRMLKNEVLLDDLQVRKQDARNHLPTELRQYVNDNQQIWNLEYPLLDTPSKVRSIRLDTQPRVEGVLTGIKGQYLIFDNFNVINIRNHAGFFITLSC